MIGIVIQARTNSTRLPKKVLTPILRNLTLIEIIILRLLPLGYKIVLATTTNPEDNTLCERVKHLVHIYRGSEHNVYSRFENIYKKYNFTYIIRITGDCPLVDIATIKQCIQKIKKYNYDYVSNVIERTYPRGLDVEIFHTRIFQKKISLSPDEKEHVTLHIRMSNAFTKGHVHYHENLSKYRLCIDYPHDLEYFQKYFNHVYTPFFSFPLLLKDSGTKDLHDFKVSNT